MPRPQNLGLVSHSIPAADWLKVIDVVNRLNMAFDYWDVEAILEVVTEDYTGEHPHGLIRGRDELRAFLDAYRPLTDGVRRSHTNHVVDANDDGTLTVTSHIILLRVAAAGEGRAMGWRDVAAPGDGLPAVFVHSLVTDRLRNDPEFGWRICARIVEDTTANTALSPVSRPGSAQARHDA
ncbi:MAG TPA: nuclear transport factor 2 family protein [Mycobacterium sp.]